MTDNTFHYCSVTNDVRHIGMAHAVKLQHGSCVCCSYHKYACEMDVNPQKSFVNDL